VTAHELARILLTHLDLPVIAQVIETNEGGLPVSLAQAGERLHVEHTIDEQYRMVVAVTASTR
jgi:hypothetical protein